MRKYIKVKLECYENGHDKIKEELGIEQSCEWRDSVIFIDRIVMIYKAKGNDEEITKMDLGDAYVTVKENFDNVLYKIWEAEGSHKKVDK